MKAVMFVILTLILFLVGCTEIAEKEKPEAETPETLSELQITACNVADEAVTCDTRLAEVGIVMKEECCQVLGKCC